MKNNSLRFLLTTWMLILLAGCSTTSSFPAGFVAITHTPQIFISTKTSDLAPLTEATIAPTEKPTSPPASEEIWPYPLTIIHTNDIHANHEPNSDGNGGAARTASVVQQIRAERPNVLLLNAGDNFTGTLYYVMHRGQDSVEIMNAIGYDAMTLGNHEFDDGEANLSAFISQVKFPIVSANIDFSRSTILNGKVQPYTIIEKGGQPIGIIGLTTSEAGILVSSIENLSFDANLTQIVQKAVEELTSQGVNKIVLLSHVGFTADSQIAQEVNGVDVIVGGHSHTLASNLHLKAVAPYPAQFSSPNGEPVLVVQAGEKQMYLGQLDVEFDENGVLTQWNGDSIYLSHFIAPDPEVSNIITDLFQPIEKLTREKVGEATLILNGERTVCRFMECNMGNLVTDAIRLETGVEIVMLNAGAIRTSIDAGDVMLGDVINVLPFGNLVSTFELKGKDVLTALENGVSRVDAEEGTGRFPQVSGIRFSFDASKPAGNRIMQVEVLDTASNNYLPLQAQRVYRLASNDFIRSGGDGYSVLVDKAINPYDFGRPLDQIVADYFKNNSPVTVNTDDRIMLVK